LRSYLTTEQTAKFLLIMEKYKSKKELNLFKLWGIKKINHASPQTTLIGAHQGGASYMMKDSDDDGGLPESNDEGDGGSGANLMQQQQRK
jgi:hypothetical protein